MRTLRLLTSVLYLYSVLLYTCILHALAYTSSNCVRQLGKCTNFDMLTKAQKKNLEFKRHSLARN